MEIVKSFTPGVIDKIEPGDMKRESGTPGLICHGNADGTKSWRFQRKAGKAIVKKTLGTTAEFSIPDAREWAAGFNSKIGRGENPIEVAARDAEADAAETLRKATTFRVVWEKYMTTIDAEIVKGVVVRAAKQSKKTIEMKRCRMVNDILPYVGDIPITEITLNDLWDVHERKLESGYQVAANHLVVDIKAFFNWCQSHGRNLAKLESNPAEHMKKLGEQGERTRFIDVWELPLLLRAMADMEPQDQRIATLMLLTGQRLDNVLRAEYSQWQPKLDSWVIKNMKAKVNERVSNVLPLGPWGTSLFVKPEPIVQGWRAPVRAAAAEAELKRTERYLFPASRGTGPQTGHMRTFCDTIMAGMQEHAPDDVVIEHLIAHDFRRTLISHGERLEFETKHIKAVVGHRTTEGAYKNYQMYRYFKQKKRLLAEWEAEIIKVAVEEGVADRLGIPSATVTPIALAA